MRKFLLLPMLLLGWISVSWAGEAQPFSADEFAAAQTAGKPIIVEIHASWCPVCAKQKPILSQLRDTKFKDLVAFAIDFDSQKDLVARFGANKQSTLIVFKGNAEKGRVVGVSDSAAITALVEKAYGS
ncbi:MAG: thioredoxin family protein [Hyphomicrobiaceae bacterium]